MEQRKVEVLTDTDVLITLSNKQKQQYLFVYNVFGKLADQGVAVSV